MTTFQFFARTNSCHIYDKILHGGWRCISISATNWSQQAEIKFANNLSELCFITWELEPAPPSVCWQGLGMLTRMQSDSDVGRLIFV